MKLTVGQQLWWVPARYRTGEQPCYVTVEKVGRKWAQLSNQYRIDVTTLEPDSKGYSSPGECYLQREEYESKVAISYAWGRLRKFMESRIWSGAPDGVTLENIEAAGNLLGFKVI